MALLKLSGLVTAISGKLGGSIMGTGDAGSYIRQNSYSQQPNTPKQDIQRTKIYQSTNKWSSISQTNKDLWTTATIDYPYTNKLGDTAYYNNYTLHNFLNSNLELSGSSYIGVPPAFVAKNIVTLGIFGRNLTAVNIIVNNWDIDFKGVLFCSPLYKNNENFKLSKLRYFATITKNPTNFLYTIILADLINGDNPQVGDYFYMMLKTVNETTGQTSDFTEPYYVELI